MSHGGGFLGPDAFRVGSGGELPAVSVTRLPPELAGRGGTSNPLAGEPGFGDEKDPPFAAGSVTGYRWWAVAAPDVPPARYEPGPLRGMHAAWQPGENTAVCLASPEMFAGAGHGTDTVPDGHCYCGFYAFWTLPPPYSLLSAPGLIPVCGVIEGYGKALLGAKGFRCAKARVLAVHVLDAGLPPGLHEAVNAALELVLPAVRVCRRLEDMTAEYPSSRPGT